MVLRVARLKRSRDDQAARSLVARAARAHKADVARVAAAATACCVLLACRWCCRGVALLLPPAGKLSEATGTPGCEHEEHSFLRAAHFTKGAPDRGAGRAAATGDAPPPKQQERGSREGGERRAFVFAFGNCHSQIQLQGQREILQREKGFGTGYTKLQKGGEREREKSIPTTPKSCASTPPPSPAPARPRRPRRRRTAAAARPRRCPAMGCQAPSS